MATSWRITEQTRTTALGPNNQFVSGWRVAYATSDNVHGDVFVPDPDYTPVKVAEMVNEAVRTVAQVHNMTGEV